MPSDQSRSDTKYNRNDPDNEDVQINADLTIDWENWPDEVQANYLAARMERQEMLQKIAKQAGVPQEFVGDNSFTNEGYARLLVEVGGESV